MTRLRCSVQVRHALRKGVSRICVLTLIILVTTTTGLLAFICPGSILLFSGRMYYVSEHYGDWIASILLLGLVVQGIRRRSWMEVSFERGGAEAKTRRSVPKDSWKLYLKGHSGWRVLFGIGESSPDSRAMERYEGRKYSCRVRSGVRRLRIFATTVLWLFAAGGVLYGAVASPRSGQSILRAAYRLQRNGETSAAYLAVLRITPKQYSVKYSVNYFFLASWSLDVHDYEASIRWARWLKRAGRASDNAVLLREATAMIDQANLGR